MLSTIIEPKTVSIACLPEASVPQEGSFDKTVMPTRNATENSYYELLLLQVLIVGDGSFFLVGPARVPPCIIVVVVDHDSH